LILVPNFGDGIWLYALTSSRADGLLRERHQGEFPKPLLTAWQAPSVSALPLLQSLPPRNETRLTDHLMSVIGISGVALLCGMNSLLFAI
jgi:hypothetical protein